jgi:hypothetical protein
MNVDYVLPSAALMIVRHVIYDILYKYSSYYFIFLNKILRF